MIRLRRLLTEQTGQSGLIDARFAPLISQRTILRGEASRGRLRLIFFLLSAPTRQGLSRSYARFFAEFLNEDSPIRLGVLHQPTCVGFRYGRHTLDSRGFSGKRALPNFSALASRNFRSAWNRA